MTGLPLLYDVAGLCNAMVDTLVRVDDAELADLERARGAMHLVDRVAWEKALARFATPDAEVHAGGSGANTLTGIGLLGGRAVFRGQVGDDEMGRRCAASLLEACGGHALAIAPGLDTGACLALVSRQDHERTMLVDLGAAPLLDDLGPFAETIRRSRVFHCTGYALQGGPIRAVALEGMEIAHRAGRAVSVDVSDPFVVRGLGDDLWRILERTVDLVFLNEEEAAALCDGAGPEEALERIAEHVPTVVVKLGRRGSLVKHEGVVTPLGIHPVQAVDSTGAGDAYAAGFLFGYTRGWSASRSGRLGARVASLAVGQLGAVCRDRSALAASVAACWEHP
ncbi:MAG: adenosine kinase [Deltaproteobacteria bacterium]|nr:adenosine kinase [Deltaproteobacteria bacterium]